MTTTAYDIGDVKRCQATFTDVNGALANPTTVTLIVREPDGNETTILQASMTNPSTGVWYYDFAIAKAGRHVERWIGTGTVAVGEKTEFWARAKGVAA
jgi:hypothetical protein